MNENNWIENDISVAELARHHFIGARDITDAHIAGRVDLCNLLMHNVSNIIKNLALTDHTKIFISKFNSIDCYILWQLNKISIFNSEILEYHEKIRDIADSRQCILQLKYASLLLTTSLLKTTWLRDRGSDVSTFLNLLGDIQNNNCSENTIKTVYNLILYAVPFSFSVASHDPDINFLDGNCPIEYVASSLYSIHTDISSREFSWTMRFQSLIEGNMPEMSIYGCLVDNFNMHGYKYISWHILLGSLKLTWLLVPIGLNLITYSNNSIELGVVDYLAPIPYRAFVFPNPPNRNDTNEYVRLVNNYFFNLANS